MATPVFDAPSELTFVSGTPQTISHTCTGADRFLWIVVSDDRDMDVGDGDVSYNSVNAPRIAVVDNGGRPTTRIFGLAGPATGANDISVVVNADPKNFGQILSASFTGVDATTPVGTFTTATGEVAALTVTVADTATDELVVDGMSLDEANAADPTAGGGQTARVVRGAGAEELEGGVSTEVATGANTVMSWTVEDTIPWATAGAALQSAAGGGAAEDEDAGLLISGEMPVLPDTVYQHQALFDPPDRGVDLEWWTDFSQPVFPPLLLRHQHQALFYTPDRVVDLEFYMELSIPVLPPLLSTFRHRADFYEPQICLIRPDGDISGAWSPSSGGDLFAMIDESPVDDADYIESAETPVNQVAEVTLGNCTDPLKSDGHMVRYRYHKGQGGGQVDLTVLLLQGGTTIATFSHTNIPTAVTEAFQALSAAQADAITDYSDLRLRFTANAP